MSNVYELEEGEINDDDDDILQNSPQRVVRKILPRRYMLQESRSAQTPIKKKFCKHVVKHSKRRKIVCPKKSSSHSEYSKIKKSPRKVFLHHSIVRSPTAINYRIPQTSVNSFKDSLKPTVKITNDHFLIKKKTSAFKNFSSPNVIPQPKSVSSHATNESYSNSSMDDLLTDYKNLKSELRQLKVENRHLSVITNNDSNLTTSQSMKPSERLNIKNEKISPNLTTKTLSDNDDESDDEDQLRQKALESCLKRNVSLENIKIEKMLLNPKVNVVNEIQLPAHVAGTKAQTADDYEVVDMDVDEDYPDVPIEISKNVNIPCNNDLFVIDTSPAFPIRQNTSNFAEDLNIDAKAKEPNKSCSDEDFEETLLRAQLILEMQKSKNSESKVQNSDVQKQDSLAGPSDSLLSVEETALRAQLLSQQKNRNKIGDSPTSCDKLDDVKCVTKVQTMVQICNKQPIMIGNTPFKSLSMIKEEINALPVTNKLVKKLKPTNFNNVQKKISPQKRIIIQLTADSSTEESEEDLDNQKNSATNSCVSLEALISRAKHRSNAASANSHSNNNTPKAVMCLSKAQQQEYSKLKKIIAQKQPFHIRQKSLDSSEDLKLLEQKWNNTVALLEKEKKVMHSLETQLSKKTSNQSKSSLLVNRLKLQVQRLQIQLTAAERTEKNNNQMALKLASQLKIVQKTVSKLENYKNGLQNLGSKLGLSMRGSNYTVPVITCFNEQISKN